MDLQGIGEKRRQTPILLAEELIVEAKALHIDLTKAAEAGVARAVRDRRAQLWVEENQLALDSSNAYVEQYGLPLEAMRLF